jgi:phage-related baseplate assembly protein
MIATVEAEEYGRQGNVTQGMICEIATTIPGVDGVINDADSLVVEACDKELDGPLQERYVLAWKNVNGLTKYAYESWARSVPGVISARVMDLHPRGQGTVDVVVKGAAGIPTQELIDKVKEVIEVNRPINDDVKVKGPVPVNAFIEAELVLVSGTPEIILSTATTRINAMFEDPTVFPGIEPLQIGEDLTLDRLGFVLMGISGIKRIKWPEGAGDILVPPDGLAVLTGSRFTLSWEDA